MAGGKSPFHQRFMKDFSAEEKTAAVLDSGLIMGEFLFWNGFHPRTHAAQGSVAKTPYFLGAFLVWHRQRASLADQKPIGAWVD
jgi:hypothetical protein